MNQMLKACLESINYSNLNDEQKRNVLDAIRRGDNFYGYIPEEGFQFIVNNFAILSDIGCLETNWLEAYVHASDFSHTPLDKLKEIFDKCDKNKLQEINPIIPDGLHRFSIFRGCAGNEHRMGMSWTSSLDKAIWYATKHKEYNDLDNFCVYASVVDKSEIYCCLTVYETKEAPEYIAFPKDCWKIEIPAEEFRLNRPR